jgi:hypothetical protein
MLGSIKRFSQIRTITEIVESSLSWGQPVKAPMQVLKQADDHLKSAFVDLLLRPSELLTHLALSP